MDNQSEEKKEIPTPPSLKASIRTMQSDIKSTQESGGQVPQPYLAEINHQEKKEAPAEESLLRPPAAEPVIPGYTGPEEPIFQPSAPAPLPPLEKKQPPPAEIAKPKGKGVKILFIISGILILGIILGLIGYYTVSAPEKEPIQKEEEPAAPAPEIKPDQYLSLFKAPLTLNEEIIISPLTLENFKNTLTASANLVAKGNLQELIIRNNDRSLIGFSKLTSLLLPELDSEEIAGMFSENFTLVIFVDQNGFWPGYIARLKPTATIIGSQVLIKENIESSKYLANLFIEDPGSPKNMVFKDGRAGDPSISTRYLVFPKTGASLNYGWLNNNLVISASEEAFKAILEKLQ